MRVKLLAAMLVWLAAAGLARAQGITMPLADDGFLPSTTFVSGEPAPAPPRAWASVEYLMWWVRSAPNGAPLITLGSNGDTVPGAIGQPGTTTFHDTPITFGNASGLRFTAGVPVRDGLTVEGSYFILEQRSHSFGVFATADDPNMTLIARPAFNVQTQNEIAYPTAFPGALTGGSTITATNQFQGFDVNFGFNVYRDAEFSFDLLTGFRFLYLNESLTLTDSIIPVAPGVLTFKGAPLDAFTAVSDFDSFTTHNSFYGGQLLGRLRWQADPWTISARAGIALGGTRQLAIIDGATTVAAPGAAPVATAGGILAQPSNIGRFYHTTIGIVPEAGLEVGYQVTRWLRVNVGYTFLLWTGVARPGLQVDRVVNPAQVPLDPGFGVGGGPPRPAPPTFNSTDFWAQGVSLGLAFTY